MGLLKRAVSRMYNDVTVTDQAGVPHRGRFDTFNEQAVRPYMQDRMMSVDSTSTVTVGAILQALDGTSYTVYNKVSDYYNDTVLRYRLDLTQNNNVVTVKRYSLGLDNQGGVANKANLVTVWTVPCKVVTQQLQTYKAADLQLPTNLLLLSNLCPVQLGDVIEFQTFFKPAKVESVKLNYPGVQEVSFDKDPRGPA